MHPEEQATEAAPLAPTRRRAGWEALPPTFRSLRHRDFRLLWTGTTLSSMSQWLQDLSVSWLVYDITHSPTLLGAASGVRALPLLFFSPWGGVAADRIDRRRLLLAIELWLLFPAFAMAVTISLGLLQVWHLFAFSLAMGTAWAFENPVRQALISNLVPREDIMNGVALNSTGFNISRFVGPMIAGFLIASVGPASNFYIQGAMYILVTLFVFQMHLPPRVGPATSTSPYQELMEGLHYVARRRSIMAQLLLGLVPSLIALPYISLMPIFAVDIYHVGAPGLGLMRSISAVGAIVGTLVLASPEAFGRKGLILLGLVAFLGVTLALFALSPTYPVALAVLVLCGAAQTTQRNTNMALLQISADDAYRGRVMSIFLTQQGFLFLGTFLAGFAADFVDVRHVVLVMGLSTIGLVFVAAWLFPELRRLD